MAEAASRMPVKSEKGTVTPPARGAGMFETLHREIDRLFDAFDGGFWSSPFHRSAFGTEPFWKRELSWTAVPAVDVVETDKSYEIMAELPGMDEKNIEVKLSNGSLTIRGEKQEDKEEKKKDYFVQERRFGSFERTFGLPEGVDREKIEASFKKGVLTVKMPKTPEAQKGEKKIAVKSA